MIWLAVLAALMVGFVLGLISGVLNHDANLRPQIKQLWQHIEILEGDKRALTESLCRAQGKPYIRHDEKKDLIPSDGWFDGKTEVKVKIDA